MTGFEVAGLVLGAIPLLISGLEHYSEGVRCSLVLCDQGAESIADSSCEECAAIRMRFRRYKYLICGFSRDLYGIML